MKKGTIKALAVGVFTLSSATAFAGGLLTNTNQSISFLRNPARNAAIGIDGVYSNPAGVAFMAPGFHLGLNWQSAWQTRTINSTNNVLFPLNVNDPSVSKKFEGKATAPIIPSVQAAYNTGKWSFQFNFAVHGGGGKCEFGQGIGTFDEALGSIAGGLSKFGATGYTANSYMQGSQYYFGITVGAAYKVNEHLSVYGGVRALYGTASYKAKISDIKVQTVQAAVPFETFLGKAQTTVAGGIAQLKPNMDAINGGIAQLEPNMGAINDGIAQIEPNIAAARGLENLPQAVQDTYNNLVSKRDTYNDLVSKRETYKTLVGAQPTLDGLEKYGEGVNLQADQKGFGVAPILGVDYKIGNFNFAAKYEFRTKMSLKNESTLTEAGILEPLKKFEDGRSIREDNPAMLSLGAQWSALPNVRINAGYHHFYDKQSEKYGDAQKLLKGGTNEYLGGVEWDITDKLTVSGGFQITKYGLSDEFMNDMSFVVDSWSFGAGIKYQLTEKVALQAAYFQTNYDKYAAAANANHSVNEYTRTNRVAGIGATFDF